MAEASYDEVLFGFETFSRAGSSIMPGPGSWVWYRLLIFLFHPLLLLLFFNPFFSVSAVEVVWCEMESYCITAFTVK